MAMLNNQRVYVGHPHFLNGGLWFAKLTEFRGKFQQTMFDYQRVTME